MVARQGNGWVLAPSLCTLVDQFDALWPHRDHASDGSIGDAHHQAEVSDHNPSNGYVDAVDIDTDLGAGPGDMQAAADSLRLGRDPRITYGIFNHRVFRSYDKPGIPAWSWAAYTGPDPHTSHLHLSIKKDSVARNDTRPWPLTQQEEDDMTPAQAEQLARIENICNDNRWNYSSLAALVAASDPKTLAAELAKLLPSGPGADASSIEAALRRVFADAGKPTS